MSPFEYNIVYIDFGDYMIKLCPLLPSCQLAEFGIILATLVLVLVLVVSYIGI